MRKALALLALAAGCHTTAPGGEGNDLATLGDMNHVFDDMPLPHDDLSLPADQAIPNDLTVPDDLTIPADLVPPADLTPLPDLLFACSPNCKPGQACKANGDCGNGGICDMGFCRSAVSCAEIHTVRPQLADGFFDIDLDGPGAIEPFSAKCDMTVDGGGWTRFNWVLQAYPGNNADPLGQQVQECNPVGTLCRGRIPANVDVDTLLIRDVTDKTYATWRFDAQNAVSNMALGALRDKLLACQILNAGWQPYANTGVNYCGTGTEGSCKSFYYSSGINVPTSNNCMGGQGQASIKSWGLLLDGDSGYASPAFKEGASWPVDGCGSATDYGFISADYMPCAKQQGEMYYRSVKALPAFTACNGNCLLGQNCATNADCQSGGLCEVGKCRAGVSCAEIKAARPTLPDGQYTIDPDGNGAIAPFAVQCDMTLDGGGWTRFNWLAQAYPAGADPLGQSLQACMVGDKMCLGRIPAMATPKFLLVKDTTNAGYAAFQFDGSNATSLGVLGALRDKKTYCAVSVPWQPYLNKTGKTYCGTAVDPMYEGGCKSFYYTLGGNCPSVQVNKPGLMLDGDSGYANAAFKLGSTYPNATGNDPCGTDHDYGFLNSSLPIPSCNPEFGEMYYR